MNFSPNILEDLKQAGWFEGREADLSDLKDLKFELFPKAKEILLEMKGLVIQARKHGMDHASTKLNFDPTLPADYEQCVEAISREANAKIYPLMEGDDGYEQYFIDEHGRIFSYNTAIGRIFLEADTFEVALSNLVRGVNQRKFLR